MFVYKQGLHFNFILQDPDFEFEILEFLNNGFAPHANLPENAPKRKKRPLELTNAPAYKVRGGPYEDA